MLSPAFEVFSMARKGGRARKSGPRHPGGQLKQRGIDPIAPALFQRIVAEAKKKMVDERLGTELGRLFIHQELTSAQVAVGFKLARIYQTFERLKGKRRSPASPSYGGGDHSIAEELMSPEALRDLEDSIDEAAEKFTSLDKWIRLNFSRTLRTRLQELCVEDKYVGLITTEDRDALDRLGLFFGFTSVKHARAQAKKPPIASTPTLKSNVPQPNIDRIYWIEVVRRLRPDLSDDDLNQAYDVQRALMARAAFRDSKPSRGKVKEITTRSYFADAPKIRMKTKA
jgi:hypothetical protein